MRVVKKVKQHIEEHYDDCGEELKSILKETTLLSVNHEHHIDSDTDRPPPMIDSSSDSESELSIVEDSSDDDRPSPAQEQSIDCHWRIPKHTLFPSSCNTGAGRDLQRSFFHGPYGSTADPRIIDCETITDLRSFFHQLKDPPTTIDLSQGSYIMCCNHCDGDTRVYTRTPMNGSSDELDELDRLITDCPVFVLVASTQDKPTSYTRYLGRLAARQLKVDGHFFCEVTQPFALRTEDPWSSIIACEQVEHCEVMRCDTTVAYVSTLTSTINNLKKCK